MASSSEPENEQQPPSTDIPLPTPRKKNREPGARTKIRQYLLANVGVVVDTKTLQEVAGGGVQYSRRLRELRDEEGYEIASHIDREDLKPGEYMLVSAKPRPAFARAISAKTRAFVLDRNGFTCQMCGAAAGEPHPYQEGRKTRLQIGHILDKSAGGNDEPENLRALCSVCNEGASNITLPRSDGSRILQQIRRSSGADQMEVLEWFLKKYPKKARELLDEIEG